jgi:hypothetical protein
MRSTDSSWVRMSVLLLPNALSYAASGLLDWCVRARNGGQKHIEFATSVDGFKFVLTKSHDRQATPCRPFQFVSVFNRPS